MDEISKQKISSTFFFMEPHKMVRIFINKVEKYKNMVLEDHRQEKRKEKKNNLNSSGWIEISTQVKQLHSTRQLDRKP
jgi:hypothetical protein